VGFTPQPALLILIGFNAKEEAETECFPTRVSFLVACLGFPFVLLAFLFGFLCLPRS
jgi:hypothetical protein